MKREPLLKRALDVALAALMLAVGAPVLLLVACAIKLEDRGPILYRQGRWGRGGKRFRVYKFRTMAQGSDRHGVVQATQNDQRVTRVGRILRTTGLDELPQLVNILLGQMSFVGPRALAVGEIVVDGKRQRVHYEEIPGFEERLSVRPGLTGLATVQLPRDAAPDLKFAADIEYVRRQSFLLDLKLVVMSFAISLLGRWETAPKGSGGASRRGVLTAWGPAVGWAALILVASSLPKPLGAPVRGGWKDYALHVIAFAILAVLTIRAILQRPPVRRAAAWAGRLLALAVFLGIAAFAAIDEWHQALLPGREPSPSDWLADVAGVLLGLAAWSALQRVGQARWAFLEETSGPPLSEDPNE